MNDERIVGRDMVGCGAVGRERDEGWLTGRASIGYGVEGAFCLLLADGPIQGRTSVST